MIPAGKQRILHKKLENLFFRIMRTTPLLRGKAAKSGPPDIFLLGDAEMRRIKKRFLPKKKGPANVLSFAEPAGWPHPESRKKKLGEVYLNLDLTGGEMDRLAPLFLHGILHILGYDHEKKGDRIKMENLEKKIAERLDISP